MVLDKVKATGYSVKTRLDRSWSICYEWLKKLLLLLYSTVCRMGGRLRSLIPFMLLICAYSTGFYFGFHYLWHLTSLIHASYPTPESMLDVTCHLTWNSCFKENKDLRSSGPWELYNFSVRHQIRRDSNLVKITSISVTHSGVMVNHSKPFALIRL